MAITKESLLEGFDRVRLLIKEETDATSIDKTRVVHTKVWRELDRQVKRLRADTARLVKSKRKRSETAGGEPSLNGGFKKPVAISKTMAKFAGWDAGSLRSRIDVTKLVCDYIRTNNLQNPNDRRQIVCDKKLAKLLDYDPAKDDKPLTYFYLQRKLQQHFPKTTPPSS
jgi:chromatin remodeling complex protein RSC6